MSQSAAPVSISAVRTGGDRRAFRKLPHRLYAADPHWVAPLNRDIDGFLAARRHPFSASGSMEFFLAKRADEVVGRIAAIENRAHNEKHGDRTGFFGFFESVDDPAVAAALFDAAAAHLRALGLTALRGPCSPSTNYECGLLVEGEPGPPVLMMAYNPPFYPALFEGQGFAKVMDLLAFLQQEHSSDIDRWFRIAARIRERAKVTFRRLDFSRFAEEVALIVELYHDAWSDNWGFVPINPGEVARMAKELKPVMRPWMGGFVVKDGREVGFHLALPDYNRVLAGLRGRLFPFGWLKLLRAAERIPMGRLLLMGVRKEFHGQGLDVLLYEDIVRELVGRGITSCEASWLLETNAAMINTLERAGARPYRRYRIYERPIGTS